MTVPVQLRGASPIVVWSREGSAWRIACRKCVRDIVIHNLDHYSVQEFLEAHTHKDKR